MCCQASGGRLASVYYQLLQPIARPGWVHRRLLGHIISSPFLMCVCVCVSNCSSGCLCDARCDAGCRSPADVVLIILIIAAELHFLDVDEIFVQLMTE